MTDAVYLLSGPAFLYRQWNNLDDTRYKYRYHSGESAVAATEIFSFVERYCYTILLLAAWASLTFILGIPPIVLYIREQKITKISSSVELEEIESTPLLDFYFDENWKFLLKSDFIKKLII